MRALTGLVVLASVMWFWSVTPAKADQCDRLESEERLIYQQFKKTKICKESTIGKGWTDCSFKAYGTEVLLVGALGTSVRDRMQGVSGSGFYVVSVDRMARVRFLLDQDLGAVLRIDGTDNLNKTGCLYNEAYITLDAQVYSPGESNMIRYRSVRP